MKEHWVPMAGGGFKCLFFKFSLVRNMSETLIPIFIFSKRVEITARCTVHMKGNQKSSFWNARNLRNNYIPESSTGLQFEPLSHQQETWGWNSTPLEGLGTHKKLQLVQGNWVFDLGLFSTFLPCFFSKLSHQSCDSERPVFKRLEWAPFEFFKPPGPKPAINRIVEDAFFEQMQGFVHSLWTGRFATGMSMVLSN